MAHYSGLRHRFIILNAPRTGSNMLCTVLNSHPEILCHHEIFNPHLIGYARHLQNTSFSLGTMEERERDPVEFLSRVWKAPLSHPVVGFKLCWRQHETIFREALKDTGLKKIVLQRRNRIKSFVSLLLARQTGDWVVYTESAQPQERVKVVVDIAALYENIAYNDQYYAEIEAATRASHQSLLSLSYEDILTFEGRLRLLKFLEVSPLDPSCLKEETIKLNAYALPDLVDNFEELASALRGTELESELYNGQL
ncbi:MAG TPA: hypothetical protein VGO91_02820 [Pyrinomonadaceae bacterium]|jgi:hypothetical protein|nr:hypothetical protein [Pyrinomonadaceae bacterium]